jgi:hypothetical protein
MNRVVVFPFACLALIITASGAAAEDWKLLKEEAGVAVYTRAVAGERIEELRAVMKMRTTVDRLVAVHLDGDNQAKWFPKCVESRVIRRMSPTNLWIYRAIANPWPIDDRDYVIDVNLTRDTKTGDAFVSFADVKGALAETRGRVRMKKMAGYWKFSPTGDGQVLVTFVMRFDPGGSTPASFINMALSRIGTDTFDGLYRYALASGG